MLLNLLTLTTAQLLLLFVDISHATSSHDPNKISPNNFFPMISSKTKFTDRIKRQTSATATAAQSSFDKTTAQAAAAMPKITDIKANCTMQSGMNVAIKFDKPFDGIVYSKDFYRDAGCRWVSANSSRTSVNFAIPLNGCGTATPTASSAATSSNKALQQRSGGLGSDRQIFEHTLIFQHDPVVQEMWDTARTLRCEWQNRFDSVVTFPVFHVADDADTVVVDSQSNSVSPLSQRKNHQDGITVADDDAGLYEKNNEIEAVEFQGNNNLLNDQIQTRMELLRLPPHKNNNQKQITGSKAAAEAALEQARPIAAGELVEIGEPLALVVYISPSSANSTTTLNSNFNNLDISIHKCTAHDESFRKQLLIIDDGGCSVRPKLFPQWQLVADPSSHNKRFNYKDTEKNLAPQQQLIVYNQFDAFKFPDSSTVIFECELSLCSLDANVGCNAQCPMRSSSKLQQRKRRSAQFDTTTTNTTTLDQPVFRKPLHNIELRKSVTVVPPSLLQISSTSAAPLKDNSPVVLTAEYYEQQRRLRQQQEKEEQPVTFCVNLVSFIVLLSVVGVVLLACTAVTFYMCIKKKTVVLMSSAAMSNRLRRNVAR